MLLAFFIWIASVLGVTAVMRSALDHPGGRSQDLLVRDGMLIVAVISFVLPMGIVAGIVADLLPGEWPQRMAVLLSLAVEIAATVFWWPAVRRWLVVSRERYVRRGGR